MILFALLLTAKLEGADLVRYCLIERDKVEQTRGRREAHHFYLECLNG